MAGGDTNITGPRFTMQVSADQLIALAEYYRQAPLSDDAKAKLTKIHNDRLGEFNGTPFNGGIGGGLLTLGDYLWKFATNFIGGLFNGQYTSIGDAFTQSQKIAGNDSRVDALNEAANRICIDMKNCASPELASVAEAVTGRYEVHHGSITVQPGPNLSEALMAAGNLTEPLHSYANPEFHPQQAHVITAPLQTPVSPLTAGYSMA